METTPNSSPLSRLRWLPVRSLKAEIGFGFGVLIAMMVLLGIAFDLSAQRSVAAVDKLLKSDARMADLSLRSAQAMLRARRAESDFLLSVGRLGVAEAHERHATQVQSYLMDMREYLTSIRVIAHDPALVERVDRIERQVQAYEDGFLAYVERRASGVVDTGAQELPAFAVAALAIDPLLEELHTLANKQAAQTRDSVEGALRVTHWTVFATMVIAAVLGVIVAAVVSRRISGSVAQLIVFSKRVAEGDFSARAEQGREREFAILANAMNRMAESIEQSQAMLKETQVQLLGAARQAGMAEVATNVLHNVGNVLNSVNVSAGMLSARLRGSKASGLARAVQLMESRSDDLGDFMTRDPKGRLLPVYLRELSQALEEEQAGMAEELAQLGKRVEHIKHIVSMQQSYAGVARMIESARIGDLVDDALRMHDDSLTRHKVEVVKEIPDLPALPLDRHRVLQILVNLISNAKQALAAAAVGDPRITLSVDLRDGGRLRIRVADNGDGIAPQNLVRIFSHGFTTRAQGHGFGLHSCVIAAQEMGGTLTAHSDGPGRGAVFSLELPLSTPDAHP